MSPDSLSARLEQFADQSDLSDDEYTRVIDAVQVLEAYASPGGEDPVVGQAIVDVCEIPEAALEREGWRGPRSAVALELSNGTYLFPSRDPEGNGPGALFGQEPDGTGIWVPPVAAED